MAIENKFALVRVSNGAVLNGKTYGMFHLVTAQTDAQVEANGALDEHAGKFSEGTGDVIIAVMGVGGTVKGKIYVVARTGGDIALQPFEDETGA